MWSRRGLVAIEPGRCHPRRSSPGPIGRGVGRKKRLSGAARRPSSTREHSVIVSMFLVLQQSSPSNPESPYWQQRVAYEISASLDEPRGVLSGTERVRYVNNSPDTLTTFSLHLYLNA